MAPTSAGHSVIVSNLGAALRAKLKDPCYVGMNAGVVRPDRDDTFYEADLVVSCTPLQADVPTIPRPTIVIEVLCCGRSIGPFFLDIWLKDHL